MIELLREAGIETEDQLRKRLGLGADIADTSESSSQNGEYHTDAESETRHTGGSGRGGDTKAEEGNRRPSTTGRPRGANAGAFISYIAVHSENEADDPDGLAHENRMALEERAIEFILETEPGWLRTPPNNPGYDLYRSDGQGQTVFCEVKAMTGTLDDRPAGMSHTQFDHAYRHGESFWLYVVEHAGNSGDTRIVRIQDPAGKARTFTYDSGWRAIDTLHGIPDDEDKPA